MAKYAKFFSLGVSPAGDNGMIQFAENGGFSASPNFYWDNTNNILNVENKLSIGGFSPMPGELYFGQPADGLMITASNVFNAYYFNDYTGNIFEIGVGPNTHSRLKPSNFHIGSGSSSMSRSIFFDNGFAITANSVINLFEIDHNGSKVLQYLPDLGFTYFNMPLSWDGNHTFKALDIQLGAGSATGEYLRINLNGVDYKIELFAI